MARRDWTRREELTAVDLRRQGLKLAAIGRRLNRPEGSVRQKLRRLGVVLQPRCRAHRATGKLIQAVGKMLAAGKTVSEAADLLNVDHAAVSRIRKRLGYPPATRAQRACLAWVFRKARGDKMPNRWAKGSTA